MTIKPNKVDDVRSSSYNSKNERFQSGRFSARNVTLKRLLENVYGIREDLISGIPAPIDSVRFNIEAKMTDFDPSAPVKRPKQPDQDPLLPLLVERFQLKTHTEIKSLAVYELEVLPGGPKLKPAAADSKNRGRSIRGDRGKYTFTATNLSMASLADTLVGQVHRTVIDKTGLTGSYDFTLQWSREDSSNPDADSAPSIFTALPEQLGLKLQPAKGPVETLVVDHVEMPTAN